MSNAQAPVQAIQQQQVQPQSPQDELTEAFTELWNSISLVVTASGFIDDEVLQKYPQLKELHDSIKELQKSSYRFRKVIEKAVRRRGVLQQQ